MMNNLPYRTASIILANYIYTCSPLHFLLDEQFRNVHFQMNLSTTKYWTAFHSQREFYFENSDRKILITASHLTMVSLVMGSYKLSFPTNSSVLS